jgi:hypothetical protein
MRSCPADITGALKSALPEGSISTGCPITAYKQQEDGTIQLLGPAASSSSGAEDAAVIATCNILVGKIWLGVVASNACV